MPQNIETAGDAVVDSQQQGTWGSYFGGWFGYNQEPAEEKAIAEEKVIAEEEFIDEDAVGQELPGSMEKSQSHNANTADVQEIKYDPSYKNNRISDNN